MFRKERATGLKNERWAGIAKQLVDYLENFQKQQDFLREIDKRIISSLGDDRTALLQFVVQQVHSLLPLSRASFYLIQGAKAVLEVSSSDDRQPPKIISLKEFAECFCRWEEETGLWERTDSAVCAQGFHSECVLAVPARQGKLTLGILLVEIDQAANFSQLADREVCRFLHTVAGQAAVAIKFHDQLAAETKLWNFTSKLYDTPFDPMAKLNDIARYFLTFLPECEKDRPDGGVYVQILFIERLADGPVLTIRGSTDPDRNPGLTQVNVADSVCGLLVTSPERPYLLCDPEADEEYRDLYKGYLGKGEGGAIRCELAIPLADGNGERFAILNLESTQQQAFLPESVPLYMNKAQLFAPIISAIKGRIESHALAQTSTLQVLESYLGLVSKQYLHSLRTPYLALSQGLELVREKLERGDKDLSRPLEFIQASVSDIYGLQNSFAADIIDFASPKLHGMRELLEGALDLFNQDALLKNNNIVFHKKLEPGIQVECSLFMKQVFYNIIHNAITWLDKKRESQHGHQGVVEVRLEKLLRSMEGEEEELNRFCRITIKDNGPGVPGEYLDKIMNNAFTLRGAEGTGFGLYAAKQYVLSLGGRIEVASDFGENFTVTICLRRIEQQG